MRIAQKKAAVTAAFYLFWFLIFYHLFKSGFVDDFYPQLFRLVQLAARFFPGQNQSGLRRHGRLTNSAHIFDYFLQNK